MIARPLDFWAAGFIQPFVDDDLLKLISKQSVTARTMEIIQRGLNNKQIQGTFLLAGVGFVREEDRDGIAQTSDFLLRHEGVETALVYGIVNGDVVDGSLRTNSVTIDPDGWLSQCSVPTLPEGLTGADERIRRLQNPAWPVCPL